MHATLKFLKKTDFPSLRRDRVQTLQVNLGYTCNQSCVHCHVNAGPQRREQMDRETIDLVLQCLREQHIQTLDLTGGAPELNPHFRHLITQARALGVAVIDRCNLTILFEPGQEDTAQFLAHAQVQVVASLPCYLEDNVDRQRGKGVFASSVRALQRLNQLGYGRDERLSLTLVYNPQGPSLPPDQVQLEADYRRFLAQHFDIQFTRLFALANMPIARFGSTLVSKGQFAPYMHLLRQHHRPENLANVMCRNLLSVDWQGYLYDCDFNQMLELPLRASQASELSPSTARLHLRDWRSIELNDNPITIADHCYGCTAGQGSSCGGALESAPAAMASA